MLKLDENLKQVSVESNTNNKPTFDKFTYGQIKSARKNINFLEEYSEDAEINPAYIEAIEKLDWTVHQYDDDDDVELENWSPAGENLIVYTTKSNFVQGIVTYAENFDPDEHIEMWVEAKRTGATSGIPDIRTLVQDADDIAEMLDELAIAVQAVDTESDTITEYYNDSRVENDKQSLITDIMRYLDVELPDITSTTFECFYKNKDQIDIFALDRAKACLQGAYNFISKSYNEFSQEGK